MLFGKKERLFVFKWECSLKGFNWLLLVDGVVTCLLVLLRDVLSLYSIFIILIGCLYMSVG